MGYKKGAEIGVAAGYFSEILCQAIDGLELYCIDPWRRYRENPRGGGQTQHDNNWERTRERLGAYNCHIMRERSMDAVKSFEDESLDFVFIDANHNYEFVRDDIREWSKKVRPGGIVSGHDYYVFNNAGVIQAVDEYVKEYNYKLFIIPKDPTAKRKDHRHPCWWFVKK